MSKIYWLNKDSRLYLSRDYLVEGTTPEQRIREISERAEKLLDYKGYADKFEDYMHRGWYSLASPIWSNFGNGRGLPISCNGSYIADDMAQILYKQGEVGIMTKHGAGTSGYFGDLRPRGSPIKKGGKSTGPVHFLQLFETTTNVVSQSNIRRGSFAAYMPVEHPDILEFLDIRENGNPIQKMSIGVCIGDQWMKDMIAGDKKKRTIWRNIIKKRYASGYPYIFFSDTVNNNAPQVYKNKSMKIYASNLCSEIALSSSSEESFVCDLSSMNLLHYHDWKDTDAVEILTYFLDSVMTEYIELVKDIPFMKAPYTFAVNQRALGLGVLGWHSLLQSKNIAFESMDAKFLNHEVHAFIAKRARQASQEMSVRYGEPPLLKGYGLRNVTQMAIAPTTSSSFILGQVSSGIEPYNSNYHTKDLAKGKFAFKNPYLEQVLEKYEKNDEKTWTSILKKGGSVQHLSFLTEHEKNVFKTFAEISQKEIIIQAANRQKYIDQSQSLNVMIAAKTPPKDVSDLMIFAWEQGIKTIYYQRGTNPSQELSRSIVDCVSCHA